MKYDNSEFMKILGKQIVTDYCEDEDIFERFAEIMEVNEVPEDLRDSEFIQGLVMDAFLYGTVQGIKSERSRGTKDR